MSCSDSSFGVCPLLICRVDEGVLELERALPVALQVVRLTDEGDHLVIRKAALDGRCRYSMALS